MPETLHGTEFGYPLARWLAHGGQLLVTDGEKGGYLLPFRREPMVFPALAQEVVDYDRRGGQFHGRLPRFALAQWRPRPGDEEPAE